MEKNEEMQFEDNLVEMLAEDGEELYFYEMGQFECDGQKYAVLVDLGDDPTPCSKEELEKADQTIAKVVYNEVEQIDEYVAPEDEEFDQICAYLDENGI